MLAVMDYKNLQEFWAESVEMFFERPGVQLIPAIHKPVSVGYILNCGKVSMLQSSFYGNEAIENNGAKKNNRKKVFLEKILWLHDARLLQDFYFNIPEADIRFVNIAVRSLQSNMSTF